MAAIRPGQHTRATFRAAQGLEHLHALGVEDLVEVVDELAGSIADQSPGGFESIAVGDDQVAGVLCGPGSGWVGGDTGEEHLTRLHVDEEQDVVAAHERGVDGEEVAGDCGLGVQELGPSHLRAVRGRVDAGVGEDLPDSRLSNRVSEAGKFALDAAVSPRRVLGGESDDQFPQLCTSWWSAAALMLGWLGPVAGDTTAVLSQQRFGCHQPAVAGERGSDRTKQGPVVVGYRRAVQLSASHVQLVAQRDDLEVLGASGTNSEPCEGCQEAVEDTKHSEPGWRASSLVSAHARVSGHHRPERTASRAWSAPTRRFSSPTGP